MTKCIMIVDDSPSILSLFGFFFKDLGYQILTALNSTSALEILKESTPDLFILDVMMPEINGIELCQLIRALPRHEQTPVIILSAFSDPKTIEQTFAAGANDYVIKPFVPSDFLARIQELLGATQE